MDEKNESMLEEISRNMVQTRLTIDKNESESSEHLLEIINDTLLFKETESYGSHEKAHELLETFKMIDRENLMKTMANNLSRIKSLMIFTRTSLLFLSACNSSTLAFLQKMSEDDQEWMLLDLSSLLKQAETNSQSQKEIP